MTENTKETPISITIQGEVIHSFIPAISIAPIQVLYYSEALPTQQGYCAGVSRRSVQATAGKGLAQDPDVAARAGVEPTILRLKVIFSTKAPPRPTTGFAGLLHAEKAMIARQITWAKGGRELIKICHRDSVMKRETAVVSCTPWMYTHVETSMGLLWKIDGFVSRCLKNSV